MAKIADADPMILRRLVETIVALPGMAAYCPCVRKTKKPRPIPLGTECLDCGKAPCECPEVP